MNIGAPRFRMGDFHFCLRFPMFYEWQDVSRFENDRNTRCSNKHTQFHETLRFSMFRKIAPFFKKSVFRDLSTRTTSTTHKTSRNKGSNESCYSGVGCSNAHLSLCFSMCCEWSTFSTDVSRYKVY